MKKNYLSFVFLFTLIFLTNCRIKLTLSKDYYLISILINLVLKVLNEFFLASSLINKFTLVWLELAPCW